jgi:hypothetical protein
MTLLVLGAALAALAVCGIFGWCADSREGAPR